MTTQSFDFTGSVTLTYDENSPQFQDALATYREADASASASDMLKFIAGCLTHWGDHECHLPDFGYYVALKGDKPAGTPYCGVEVENTYDERYFD